MRNRTYQIYEIIKEKKSATVEELANLYGVSEKTIRLDLQNLEDAKLITRTYGGAILTEKISDIFPGISYNMSSSVQKKEIALKALEFIHPYSTIILDDGTTNQTIAKELGNFPLNVVTNDFAIASILSSKNNIELYFIGGSVKKMDGSYHTYIHSGKELNTLKKLSADIYFVGTNSINTKDGFMIFNDFVKDIKTALMSISNKTICVADSKKFDKASFYRFANFKDISTVITDSLFDTNKLAQYKKHGLNIIVADKYEKE